MYFECRKSLQEFRIKLINMSISKGYRDLVRIGISLFLSAILYQLIVVQLLGNKGYDLRVGRKLTFLFSPHQQFIPILLLSFFIVYFIGEYRHQYKRVWRNLLILFCGLSVLVLTFLFAKHIHQLYYSTVHKFEAMPKNIGLPSDFSKGPVHVLYQARNVLLAIDAILAICMIYLWYNWSEVPAKNKS